MAEVPRTNLRVVIVGGGLAGMAAAVALESTGANVTLLEARRNLGGRASSYEHPTTGEELDNCQHVLLGCCTNLLNFYDRIGVRDLVHFEKTVHFLDPKGRRHDLGAVPGLPAPLHLGPAFLRFSALTWGERLDLARAMLAILQMSRAERDALADVPFGQWLAEHRQPDSLVRKLYDPILIGALNDACQRCSATYAIQVLKESLLTNAAGYVMGLPGCPLSQLYATLPLRDLRLGARVNGLVWNGRSVAGIELQGGETIPADAVVLATNHHALAKWVPEEHAAADERFTHLSRLESVPILGAHMLFDRPILTESHVAFIDGPLQWLFRKDAEGRAVHGVISAAREWTEIDRGESLRLFTDQIRHTLPRARDAELVRGTTVIEKRATFSPVPGIDRWRPAQAPPNGGIPNLFLAGDYTRTGWPATMEGAVRSGYLAAEALLARWPITKGTPPRFLVPDLPVQWPGRLMGMDG